MRRGTLFLLSLLSLLVLFSSTRIYSDVPPDVTVLGQHGIEISHSSHVEGNLFSDLDVLLDIDVSVMGDVFATGDLYLANGSLVDGDVFLGGHAIFSRDAGIQGVLNEDYSPLPSISIPEFPSQPGIQDVNVRKGGRLTLPPGAWRNVSVDKDATLVLAGGDYHLATLSLDKNVQLEVRAPATVRLTGVFHFKKDMRVKLSDEVQPSDFILSSATTDTCMLDKNITFQGRIYLPYGTLQMGKDGNFTGIFMADEIQVGPNAVIEGIAFACIPREEICDDGIDQDCDESDLSCADVDQDGDGFTPAQGDCNDADASVHPDAAEICDGIDNNCNDEIDEGVKTVFYLDNDADGYGQTGLSQEACTQPESYAGVANDCNDADSSIHPNAAEICDGSDNNCDGNNDEGLGNCYEGEPLPPPPAEVAPPLNETQSVPLSEAVNFLYTGTDPIQKNVDAQEMEPVHAGLIRGRVLQRNGDPLPGATLTIKNHPEYGSTLSRIDGWFDMAVNGGATLVVHYERAGYLSADRKAKVEWQEYAFIDDVALVPVDSAVTTVSLADIREIAIARAAPVQDEDGLRQATLLFTPNTTATMIMPDGSTQPLNDLHVRATEYTVGPNGPDSMPAALPANSAYTYAVELSADEELSAGAVSVIFSQPVIFYVENFLNFPDGENVPTGYYDVQKSAWIASDNGRIIKLLSIADGMADLDVTGSGQASDAAALAGLGITDGERAKLAALYPEGTSLWRVLIPHFSSWDCNWGFSPPATAVAPSSTISDSSSTDSPNTQCGSVIGCENQTLGEAFPVTGTPFSLHYQSDRQRDRIDTKTITVKASGATLPATVKRIEIEIEIAGRKIADMLPAQPNTNYAFTWDGRDVYGRVVQGAQFLSVKVGYVYDGVYKRAPQFGANGSGTVITGSRTRQEVTFWQTSKRLVGNWTNAPLGLGGASLSVQHAYDVTGKTLYKGDGTQESNQGLDHVAVAFAGNGTFGSTGDAGPAGQATFQHPHGVVVDSKGNVYISDESHKVRKVDPQGIVATFAGTGTPGYSGDGGLATQANLFSPRGLAVDQNDNLYIADAANNRIRKVTPAGIITTVAGSAVSGFSGDGGPATQASLRTPTDVAVGRDGNIYIADTANYRIRRVSPDGIISTFAGIGSSWSSGQNGDNGPAVSARICGNVFQALNKPVGVATDEAGNVYVSEFGCDRVRKITPDGVIRSLAGGGPSSFETHDGIPALAEYIDAPHDMTVDPEGNVFIGVKTACRVRKVDTYGIITTLAGTGSLGSCTTTMDMAGPATGSKIGFVEAVAIDSAGNLYVASPSFNRVIKIQKPFTAFTSQEILVPDEANSLVYRFNSNGRHLQTLNALTMQPLYTFGYDPDGLLTAITDGDQKVTMIARQTGQVTLTSPYGLSTVLLLDLDGHVVSIADPAQEQTRFTYKAGTGLIESMIDPLNHPKSYQYDSLGRFEHEDDAMGGSKTLSRVGLSDDFTVTFETLLGRKNIYHIDRPAAGGLHRESTDPADFTTTRDIGTDQSEKTVSPDGSITTIQYRSDPRFGMLAPIASSLTVALPSTLTSTTTQARSAVLSNPQDIFSLVSQTDTMTVNNRTYTRLYTAAAQEFTNTSPQNRITKTEIDAQGRVTKSEVTNIDPVNYSYDTQGRLQGITQGNNLRPYGMTYDNRGFLDTVTDPLNRVVSFDYDLAGRVTKQILPDLREIHYGYDANGNLTSITPPGRPGHDFTYNAVNLAEEYLPPNLGLAHPQTSYDYNQDRQLELITRPDGKMIDFVYGAQTGRLDKITVARGDYAYAYDPQTGQLKTITTPDGNTLDYAYDGFLLKIATWAGNISGTVSRNYDANFRVTSLLVNNGDGITLGYDNDSLLTSAGSETITRRADNGLISGTTLGVTTTTPAYNTFGELISETAKVNASSVYDVAFLRDDLGRIYDKTETISGNTDHYIYTYDEAGRLATAKLNAADPTVYGYDDNGNRTTLNGTAIGTYDDQDRLISYGANAYTYNDNGDLETKTTQQGETQYNYDELGNLMSVTMPNGDKIDYVIDGQNRRVGKKVNGVLVQAFLYENQLRPIAELDGSGAVVSRFVYGTKGNVSDYLIKNGVTYRIVSDHLGSPRLIVDTGNGNIAQRIDYDEYGIVLQDTAPGFQPFGFAGGIYDQHTKLVRFGARDYDAEVGRWTAKDPIRFDGGDTNLYGYVMNDPINWIDPAGLQAGRGLGKGVFGGGTGATIGGISVGLAGATVGSRVGGAPGAIVGGIVGGMIGAKIGGVFDPPCAGQLNCGEPEPERPPPPNESLQCN